ncbi:unnamed protein product [Cuscuta epithymum]|uniref:Proline-tRNA ligase class II C-terminal domain-containing protein n=1 Tax=Cuscuta epithymum TaxID=186058 RepID=A0AAV0EFH0_9ASTE|nr:unnamed protein product [Cuscuta epithymum]
MLQNIWNEFVKALNDDQKLILAPWCDEKVVEKDVKAQIKGKMGASNTLCCPFEQPELPKGMLCFAIGGTCQDMVILDASFINLYTHSNVSLTRRIRILWHGLFVLLCFFRLVYSLGIYLS